ncbi:hypothetical protein CCR75_007268 [Bremia lactucae]|uniref:Chromatin assembly factor 1 subunit A dimerization domain-containing protein n=1 Tax=Bremia lactucae TaxID=4779 RepID=A0A976FR94_BRELC|nr:hypothetical protein CCR75_001280 [Bremia lactucae]TDH71523.1 hypothetical protein CCR75_007268 [Bremia lactucae]
MVEPKKESKQATIFRFFSPSKSSTKSDEIMEESDSKSVKAKRPRSIEDDVTTTIITNDPQKALIPATKARIQPARTTNSIVKSTPMIQAKTRRKKGPDRFRSPHAAANSDEDNDSDEAFQTPEAKRAREELGICTVIVPAGALIDDDALAEESAIPKAVGRIEERSGGEDACMAKKVTKPRQKKRQDKHVKVGTAEALVTTKPLKTLRTKATKTRHLKGSENASIDSKSIVKELLNEAIQARVDTYKLKTKDLTRQYMQLLCSSQESDKMMQDIYGVVLDQNLETSVNVQDAMKAFAASWKPFHAHETSNMTDLVALPTAVDFSHEVNCLIVKGIQGQTASLSVVTSQLVASFKCSMKAGDTDLIATLSTVNVEKVETAMALALEMAVKMLAQRTPYGVRPVKANVFEDTTEEALWVWEVGNLDKYFSNEALKFIKRMRKNRKRLGQQLKSLARVVQLLSQTPVDEAKVSAEEAKVGKFGLMVDAEVQKCKDRELKEQEKRHAAIERKEQERERQEAKDMKEKEKRNREQAEKENQKTRSSKRQKRFLAFFEATPSCSVETRDTGVETAGNYVTEYKADVNECMSSVIHRMDAAIEFLGDGSPRSCGLKEDSVVSILSSLKKKHDADSVSHGWSARRQRDHTRGVMKLLQFHENNRPAYYGTYSTQTSVFRGGRRPFAQSSKLDYSVDSDDEWEEDEPGESLSDDEIDGEESDEDHLDYGDQWLAYEDEVDYMDGVESEEDAMDRVDGSLSPSKHKLPSQLLKKRVKVKSVKPAKLEPQIVGPFWSTFDENSENLEHPFLGMMSEVLCDPVFESTLMRKAREYEEECERQVAVQQEQQRKTKEEEKFKTVKAKQTTPENIKQAVKMPETVPGQLAVSKKSKRMAQKSKAVKTTAKLSASLPNVINSTAVASLLSSKPQIDSFFKKVEESVPVSLTSQQLEFELK